VNGFVHKTIDIHPAIIQLLWLQSRGRRRRMWQRFCQTRRLALSAVACLLTVVWLGNAAMTVWLREAASEETLRGLLSLGLVLYAAWHLAKVAFFRPESPFEWTPAEREVLAMLPLAPRDVVAYQLASVTVTTSLKSGLFAVLLLPDLRCLPLALIGLLLAMMTLELLRMATEIVTWGMGRTAFLAYRTAVVSGFMAAGFAISWMFVHKAEHIRRINVGEGLLQRLLEVLLQSNASIFSYVSVPIQPLIDLIVADRMTATNIGLAAASVGITTLLAVAVISLYTVTARHVVERERHSYHPEEAAVDSNSLARTGLRTLPAEWSRSPMRCVPWCGGAGPLVWRQLIGARRCWGSLLTAMIAPAILASAPCMVIANADVAFLATAGTLAFYTFLLLPTALRFDFRRDLDRMAMLKGLPITPAAAVIGQTLAPVLIATLFQFVVLAFAVVVRTLPPHYLFSTMLVMLPMNVLVFSLENLIFLLYPYRLQQEGLEIFVRTMLTFTGKGLLFAVGLGAMSVWGFLAAALARGVSHQTGIAIDPFAVFTAGMTVGPAALAVVVLYALCRSFQKLDAIEDVPR
jgi:hypothetical protein